LGTHLGSNIYLIIANNYTLRLNLLNLNVNFQSSVFFPNGGNTILVWMVTICFELVIWWFEFKCMTIVQHMEVLCKVEDHFILLNAKLERHCDVRSNHQESRTIMCQTNCFKYRNWSNWGFFLILFLLTTLNKFQNKNCTIFAGFNPWINLGMKTRQVEITIITSRHWPTVTCKTCSINMPLIDHINALLLMVGSNKLLIK